MSDVALTWRLALAAASVINVIAWLYVAAASPGRWRHFSHEVKAARRAMLALSAVYVAGCAFRSFLPMIDVPRLCLHETWVSRIAIGRTVATVAELAFVAQWAVLLREAALRLGYRPALAVAVALVPMIVAAEAASWIAVLTTNNLFHAVENSLWTLAAALAAVACVGLWPLADRSGRRVLAAVVAGAVLYVGFMVTVDVPMYVTRWVSDTAAGRHYLPLATGMAELLQPCRVVRDWSVWREDALWLSLYFTVAVWTSIALAAAPPFRRADEARANAA